jgi:hypothetical protein
VSKRDINENASNLLKPVRERRAWASEILFGIALFMAEIKAALGSECRYLTG